jgi:predicted metal-dependent hydrolase
VLQKKKWIVRNIREIKERKVTPLIFTDQLSFETYSHTLRIVRHEGDQTYSKINGEYAEVFIPFGKEVSDPRIQEFIKQTLVETLRYEAKKFLPPLVKDLADKHGFKYAKVSLKNMKSRWGSCSVKNNINLSIYLMSVPAPVREYVVLHELVHTVEKNHGPMFWKRLEEVCPGALNHRRDLKKYSTELRNLV